MTNDKDEYFFTALASERASEFLNEVYDSPGFFGPLDLMTTFEDTPFRSSPNR
jgi:hypothetical protein